MPDTATSARVAAPARLAVPGDGRRDRGEVHGCAPGSPPRAGHCGGMSSDGILGCSPPKGTPSGSTCPDLGSTDVTVAASIGGRRCSHGDGNSSIWVNRPTPHCEQNGPGGTDALHPGQVALRGTSVGSVCVRTSPWVYTPPLQPPAVRGSFPHRCRPSRANRPPQGRTPVLIPAPLPDLPAPSFTLVPPANGLTYTE